LAEKAASLHASKCGGLSIAASALLILQRGTYPRKKRNASTRLQQAEAFRFVDTRPSDPGGTFDLTPPVFTGLAPGSEFIESRDMAVDSGRASADLGMAQSAPRHEFLRRFC
jgi:hypothetical protein